MKSIKFIGIILALLLIFSLPMSSEAYDLPSVNLGFTSFMDGSPPSGPGFYLTQYVQYWTSDEFKDSTGKDLLPPAAGEDLNAWISLTQFIYQSDFELMLGAKWGLDVIVPYVILDLDYDTAGPFPADNGAGFGDLLVGPYQQWDPVMGPNGPKFMHRLEFQCLLPTGEYDQNKELNPGSNFFSFNPYWAATWFITPKFTVSSRLHYLLNDKNDEPNRAYVAQGAYELQAGQAFHINLAAAYEILPNKLRLGLNSYYLKQVSESEMNRNDLSGTKEQVFGIGPGLVYHISKDAHFFFNAFIETEAENRPEGSRMNFRFVYHF
jgi:hypothetical protein